jgi:hypothetical protein
MGGIRWLSREDPISFSSACGLSLTFTERLDYLCANTPEWCDVTPSECATEMPQCMRSTTKCKACADGVLSRLLSCTAGSARGTCAGTNHVAVSCASSGATVAMNTCVVTASPRARCAVSSATITYHPQCLICLIKGKRVIGASRNKCI